MQPTDRVSLGGARLTMEPTAFGAAFEGRIQAPRLIANALRGIQRV
jgi:hypothetical protein